MNTKSRGRFLIAFSAWIIALLFPCPAKAEEIIKEKNGLIRDSLEEDQAYLSAFKITRIIDGTESFDTSDDPESPHYKNRTGNDENDSNGKVRTFDVVTYNLSYQTAVYKEEYYERGTIQFEFLLPLTEKEAVWDTETMSWMDYGWKIDTEDRRLDVDGDGKKEVVSCQVLKGEKTLVRTSTNPTAIPGKGTLVAAVKVRAMKNGADVSPVLTAWMEHNCSGSTELGKENSYPAQSDEKCIYHERKEQITVQADKIKVTAEPRYNVQLKQGMDSYNQVIGGTYDFDEGNEKALDKGLGKVTGTTTAYGVTLQLYNDKGKDLKGIELPQGAITFDLVLDTAFVPAEGMLTDSQKKYVSQNYAPLVLSWGSHMDTGKTADGRKLGENTGYVVRGAPGNVAASWNDSGNSRCYQGGVWKAVKKGNTISVTVTGYEIDIDKFPNANMGDNRVESTYYDYKKGVENIGCFSAGMFYILTPTYNNGTTSPERKNRQILEDLQVTDGTFQTTIRDVRLKGMSVSGQKLADVEDNSNQTGPATDIANQKYGDDSITSTVYLSRPGSYSCRNQYSMADDCGGAKEMDPLGRMYLLKEGNWGNGRDALARGHDCAIMNGLVGSENGDMNNRIYAANVLAKFDAEAIELTGKSSFGYGVKSGNFDGRILYAAKADGTNWKNDEEMVQAKMEDLRYFGSLDELEQSGCQCVGFMAEYRPEAGEYARIKKVGQGALLYAQAEGRVRKSAVPGHVYQTVVAIKGWCGRDYIKTTEQNGVPSLLENDPQKPEELPKATYAVYHPYEKARYNESGYAGGHTGSYNYGDSLYILDTVTRITKKVEQSENGASKSIYHVSDGQRYVDYVLKPAFAEESENQGGNTKVTVTDILPEKLSYVPGSAYLGGTYVQNPAPGQTGSVQQGIMQEPKVTKNEDGTCTLEWKFLNVHSNDDLPEIHYSAQIGMPGDTGKDVRNNEEIVNVARVKSDGDLRDYAETLENEAKTGIRISKLEKSSPSKIPDQRFHDVTDSVGYTIHVGNNGSTDMEKQLVMDSMPVCGDDKGNDFSGELTLEEMKIDPEKLGNIEDWECYYTESPEAKNTTAKAYDYRKIAKNWLSETGGTEVRWTKAEINPDGSIEGISGMHPTAVVWTGELKGGKTLCVQCRLRINGAKGGDVIVNSVSWGGDETARPKVYFVDRSISGVPWLDANEDGQRQPDEKILGGVRVYLMKRAEDGSYGPVLDQNGEKVFTETQKPGESSRNKTKTYRINGVDGTGKKAAYEVSAIADISGGYRFENLPSGDYGIRFASGTTTMDKFVQTKTHIGDDATDSDGMEIRGIILPPAKELLVAHYECAYQDVGLFYKKGSIKIRKTDTMGRGLAGVRLELESEKKDGTWEKEERKIVTGKEGLAEISGLSPGKYRLTEKETIKGMNLLKDPIEVSIPYVSDTKGDTEPDYMEDGKYYYLNLSYQIKNTKVFPLPLSGKDGYAKWYLTGLLFVAAGIAGMRKMFIQNS